jgi:hypothetical protein
LLIPIETLVPALHAEFDDAMWTFHVPSNVEPAAAAGVITGTTRTLKMLLAINTFLK